MTELKVLGKQCIAGKTFTGIEGGFGEGKIGLRKFVKPLILKGCPQWTPT